MSSTFIILFSGAAACVVLYALHNAARMRTRTKARSQPFPPTWEEILHNEFPPYPFLPDHLRTALQDEIQEFLFSKTFEGCDRQEITDEIRVLIAAQACVLLLNRDVRCYPKLRSILVYPSTYVANNNGLFGGGSGNGSVRLGESWNTGVVVLAWDSVKRGALNFDDGHNVTMHEFAHQLDQEDGAADGAPILPRTAYASWARVLSSEYTRLKRFTRKGRKTVMDRYGATNPAEFFAVATETFFEKPKQLHKKHPELYSELKTFYHLNPIEWQDPQTPKIRTGQHA
jgi:Mlc titration factor MtfA (ptsG expression regulator)